MEKIEFTGLKELGLNEQEKLKTLMYNKYKKIENLDNNLTKLKVNIKTVDKGGQRKRYILQLKAEFPSKKTFTSEVEDWLLSSTCHKAINDLKNEIEKAYEIEGKNWKPKQ